MFDAFVGIWNVIGPILFGFGNQYPVVLTVVVWLGVVRFFMKPIMTAIDAYILQTPTKSDDEKLAWVKGQVWYKIIVFILDWALSVKLPK